VPAESEPLLVTFNLNNPSIQDASADYQLYANGNLVMEGATELSPLSSKKYFFIVLLLYFLQLIRKVYILAIHQKLLYNHKNEYTQHILGGWYYNFL